jgi:4-alpha-glucanotransferase
MHDEDARARLLVRDALNQLRVKRFVLGVHASAFPRGVCDAGYGAPLSDGGQRLLTFAARLGFDALQMGPAGQVTVANLSPYDGTVFARNTWSLDIGALAEEEFARLAPPEALDQLGLGPDGPPRLQPRRVDLLMRRVLDTCHIRLTQLRARDPEHPLLRDFERFRSEQAPWLGLNAACDVITARLGDDRGLLQPAAQALFEPGEAGFRRRAALRNDHRSAFERSELAQYLCHAQHAQFRALARAKGLALWGDIHTGFSHRDHAMFQRCFARRWLVGAPPSRTNPRGQPWGYPLLDPSQLDEESSPARRLVELRLRKILSEHDGIRIDHPHGLVCPWIYRESDPDAYHAIRHGARAFESPDDPDPDLARWAIARSADLDLRAMAPYADDRVRHLEDAQVTRYSRLFDVLVRLCDGRGEPSDVIAAEVLSTCPYPLRRVLARYRLGRFRVTQKADPTNPDDGYRTEHARFEDWVMAGTHDTPPLFPLALGWVRDGSARSRAAYLAERLIDDPADRHVAAARFASSTRELLCASLADLFASGAESVYVFVGDLFGEIEPFNRAGEVHPDNWTARLPDDFEDVYAARVAEGRALDIAAALRLALTRTLPSSDAERGAGRF